MSSDKMPFLTEEQIRELEFVRNVFINCGLTVDVFRVFPLQEQIEIFAISERAIADFGCGLLSQITAARQTLEYIKTAQLI